MTIINHRPRRLQRSRRPGYRTPEGAIYCGRPTVLGNPFMVQRFGQARSVKLHRRWLLGDLPHPCLLGLGFDEVEIEALRRLRQRAIERLPTLTARDLVCWCSLAQRWCHAETLLEFANSPALLDQLTGLERLAA